MKSFDAKTVKPMSGAKTIGRIACLPYKHFYPVHQSDGLTFGIRGKSSLGNQIMRRVFGTAGFALAGLASVVMWTLLDSRLCSTFSRLCTPRVGECGGGVDACAVTVQTTIELFAYIFAPPVLFAVLGFHLFGRRRPPLVIAGFLVSAVTVHWLSAFLSVRVLRIVN
ncbi:hypothetical protein [Burkholderia stagnalis]|uniref:hypothetical protein n=1 Tax=Burkholderia stagnalis TaxID=1503054 RepID=UPI001E40A673|nr:hypothetical protein [Burkholderia stagnalis]